MLVLLLGLRFGGGEGRAGRLRVLLWPPWQAERLIDLAKEAMNALMWL